MQTARERHKAAALAKLYSDFPHYAARVLRIKPKTPGPVVPFALNRAQLTVHNAVEWQRKRIGKVRVIVLKGRQQGISTYTEGRFYWRTSTRPGLNAYILTHEQKATDNIFAMVRRYYEHTPQALRPATAQASAKELYFSRLTSGYKVATAGAKGTGRSGTVQLFHGSEVAFWPNADEHMAGLGQSVADAPGTEVILESTANGVGNLFHAKWLDALAGRGDYIAVFIPWFWQPEYQTPLPPGFVMDDEEVEYQALYGVTNEQIAWRRKKIVDDFAGDYALFDQEYPATPELAFRRVDYEPYILPGLVQECVNAKHEARGAVLLGVDPAEYGDDSTALIVRRGRKVLKHERCWKKGPMEVVGIAGQWIDEFNPDGVFVDATGIGAGVYDRLVELGNKHVYRVMAGARATADDLYTNKRAEMWGLMKQWLRDGADIPNDAGLVADLSAPGFKYDSARRTQLEKKEDMKKRGVPSPDMADALALTFAQNVKARTREREGWRAKLREQHRRQTQGSAQTA